MRAALNPSPASPPASQRLRRSSPGQRLPAAALLRIGATLMYVAALAVGATRG